MHCCALWNNYLYYKTRWQTKRLLFRILTVQGPDVKKFFLIISDRHVGGSDAEKADHETKFKEINEAYTILSDARKKATYDAGQDVDQNHHDNYNPTSNNFHSAHHMDAAQMFKAFFGSGPGMHHAYQHHFGGFGGSGNTSGSGHQMPGSFFQFSWFIFLHFLLCYV